jgi:hypothetical protein
MTKRCPITGRFIPNPENVGKPKRIRKPKPKKVSSSPNITPVASPTPVLVNNVCFCIDGSGSMGDIKHDVVKTVNQWLGTLRDKANSENQKTYISMLRFSSTVRPFMNNVDVNDARQVSVSDTYDGNMTALRDAVMEGRRILSMGQTLHQLYPSTSSNVASLLILVTDGQENSSRTSSHEFNRAIREMLEGGTYTIVCLVPNNYARDWLVSLGVPASNIEIWENTKAGVEQIEQSVTTGLGGYYTCRSMGQSSMMGFFGQ